LKTSWHRRANIFLGDSGPAALCREALPDATQCHRAEKQTAKEMSHQTARLFTLPVHDGF
jgi:hypothetical protein